MNLSQFYAVYTAAQKALWATIAGIPEWALITMISIFFCLLMIDLFFLLRGLRHRGRTI